MSFHSIGRKMPKQHHQPKRLSHEQRNELVEAFLLFVDEPKVTNPETGEVSVAGTISAKELKVIMRALGYEPTREELKTLINQQNEVKNQLDLEQFLNLMEAKLSVQDSSEELLKSFRIYDKHDTGKIGINELREVAEELGVQLSEEDMLEMIEEADRDCDGLVGEEEFQRIQKR